MGSRKASVMVVGKTGSGKTTTLPAIPLQRIIVQETSMKKSYLCWQAAPCCYPVVPVSKAVSTAMPQRLIPV
uniref:Uncharacterized protein n=1 Tax=Salmonella enterica subsp. salamae TaxID=59202 RepID=I3W4F5_SALER|nr:hypothetical protein [Salmonella enterica subsp. salamae]